MFHASQDSIKMPTNEKYCIQVKIFEFYEIFFSICANNAAINPTVYYRSKLLHFYIYVHVIYIIKHVEIISSSLRRIESIFLTYM